MSYEAGVCFVGGLLFVIVMLIGLFIHHVSRENKKMEEQKKLQEEKQRYEARNKMLLFFPQMKIEKVVEIVKSFPQRWVNEDFEKAVLFCAPSPDFVDPELAGKTFGSLAKYYTGAEKSTHLNSPLPSLAKSLATGQYNTVQTQKFFEGFLSTSNGGLHIELVQLFETAMADKDKEETKEKTEQVLRQGLIAAGVKPERLSPRIPFYNPQ